MSNLNEQQFSPIKHSELEAGGQGSERSPIVSPEEWHQSAARGAAHMEQAKAHPGGTLGLDTHWGSIKARAYHSSRSEWGGGTYNSATGKPVAENADAYALTARDPGQKSIRVPANANKQEFGYAMDRARHQYSEQLARGDHHLGVFHDAEAGKIDIDPVMVVKGQQKAQDIGAATRNVGGAYHFKSGNGYWPPSVKG